ncbi:MAG: NAD-binding protein [Thermoplasmata archaeon]
MVNWTKIIPYAAISVGLYHIISSIIVINFNIGYSSFLIKGAAQQGEISKFFIIFYGIFLIFLFNGLKRKTWTSWYMALLLIIFYFFTSLIVQTKFLPLDIIGILLDLFVLIILIINKRKYIFPPIYSMPREMVVSLAIIIFAIIYGVLGTLLLGDQFSPPVKSLDNAIYYTVEVMTTLGFGDILPITTTSRLFTSSLVILGVASFFSAVTAFFGPIIQKRLEKVVSIMETAELSGMRDHIIFCGYMPIISSFLKELKKREIPFILIVRDQENATFLRNDGYIVLRERADNPVALKTAGIKKAKRIFISSGDDGYNLMVALTIYKLKKEMNLNIKISLFLNTSSNIEMARDFVDEIIDISDIVKEKLIEKSL